MEHIKWKIKGDQQSIDLEYKFWRLVKYELAT